MKEEIYEDVLKEEPKKVNSKEYKKWEKRLYNSIGWVTPMIKGKVFVEYDKKGNLKPISDITDDEIVYDVETGKGRSFTCDKQIDAELLSYLVQINERLKRLEIKFKK